MWIYPKVMGANPSERWGHSSVFFNGLLYIFGGCRGGVHFSDVLVCNLTTMTWNVLETFGPGPGPRDSHSGVLVGHKMFVFGGTNGSKKVNELHILDLVSREWTRPECHGAPPCARESHTTNVVFDEKLVVFGGSGEGEAHYLNDLHILDVKTMQWSSPEVSGNIPAPRDSHSSVVVGNRLFVFGGDSGDRYQGDVSVLDMNTMVWSRVDARGSSPGARAGHASVSIGSKVCILGGVGDKKYYNDTWILDVITLSWTQLDSCSQKSQGRFSHTATVTNLGIAIFGGCGEDERPLNELLILQIDSLTCKAIGNKYKDETEMNNSRKTIILGDNEDSTTLRDVEELEFIPDMLHPKRRRTSNSKGPEEKPDLDEHFVPQSDKSCAFSRVHPLFRPKISRPSNYHVNNVPINHPNPIKREHTNVQQLIGAEVRGQVDGAFDSGYLMTATVNGKAFRGVLFAPGPDLVSRGTIVGQRPIPFAVNNTKNDSNVGYQRHFQQPCKVVSPGLVHSFEQTQTRAPTSLGQESRVKSELQGVVLTLASPGTDYGML